jgi:transcriptional regulator with XRE-family HTH domain
MPRRPLTLGAVLRGLRSRNDWTLKDMSERSGIPISTLSKVEHDRLTLGYDKLQQLSQRLNIRMSELFAEGEPEPATATTVIGRRSIGTLDTALRVTTANYDYYYLCTELRHKRMIPNITRVRAKSLEEFGDLVRHSGEEFIYVTEGQVIVHTEFYDPVALNSGRGDLHRFRHGPRLSGGRWLRRGAYRGGDVEQRRGSDGLADPHSRRTHPGRRERNGGLRPIRSQRRGAVMRLDRTR